MSDPESLKNSQDKEKELSVLENMPKGEKPNSSIFPTLQEWNMMKFMAQTFHMGGAIPKGLDTVEKLIVAIQAGAELGLKPIQSVGCIGIINGKPMLYGNMPFAIAIDRGHKIKWGKCDATEATVTITRGDTGESETKTLTIEEATKRGMTGGPVWPKYPDRMLRYAVFRSISTFLLPDIYNGIKVGEDEEVYNATVDEDQKKKPLIAEPRVSNQGKAPASIIVSPKHASLLDVLEKKAEIPKDPALQEQEEVQPKKKKKVPASADDNALPPTDEESHGE